ncbi:MAG: hypothetical protein DMF53_28650 [Acidobacteria bacterium]|nr:MAG: hypothetical protein DMF53_28650 [Acidobacteriota bacterium]
MERSAEPLQGRQARPVRHQREPGEPRARLSRSWKAHRGTAGPGDARVARHPLLRRLAGWAVDRLPHLHPQEDLFVVRLDGSGLRQLTNDAFRDRYPRWSPDGSHLLFQSDRGGTYGIWRIQADGSGLEPVTRASDGTVSYPAASPDGRWLALIIPGRGGALVDLALPLEQRHPVPFPPMGEPGELFDAVSWSPDGKWVAGVADTRDARSVPGVILYSPASRSYTRLTDRGEVPIWMPGGKTLLAREEGRLLAIDVATRSLREIFKLPPNSSFVSHCVSPDGRTLVVSRSFQEVRGGFQG